MPLLNTSARKKKRNFPSSELSFSYKETWPFKTIYITVTDSDKLQQTFLFMKESHIFIWSDECASEALLEL